MQDIIYTLSARLITRYGIGPRTRAGVQVRARAWLAAETDDLAEKGRRLEAILKLDPELEWAQGTVPGMGYRRLRMNRGRPLLFVTGQG